MTVTGDPDGDGVEETYQLTTDDDGAYTIDLPPGEWTVVVDESTAPGGMGPTTNVVDVRTLQPNEVATIETGLGMGQIDGVVWVDGNGNGQIDNGEAPIPGVTVTATFAGDDGIIGTSDDLTFTTTSPDGSYSFDQVPIGQPYEVAVDAQSLPDGYTQTYDRDGVLDHRTTGRIDDPMTVDSADFGYRAPAPITPTPTPPPVLAFTGSEIGMLLLIALALLTGGGALIFLQNQTRRNRFIGGNKR